MSSSKKSEIQKNIVSLLKEVNGHAILELATGVGKTKIAIDYIASLKTKHRKRKRELRVLWVVPSEKLRDIDVPEEFYKWNKQDLLEYVSIVCYASLHKISADIYDLVVLDEMHQLTELRSSFFFDNDNQIGSVLGLTATKPNDTLKTSILDRLNLRTLHKIDVEDAREQNLISDYEVYVIAVPIGDEPVQVKTKNKEYTTTEAKRYAALTNLVDSYRARGIDTPKNILMLRMRTIYNFMSKAKVAKNLLKHIEENKKRVLVFTKSVDICNFVVGNDRAYHYKAKNKAYSNFLSGESDVLGVVDSVNEGVNLPDLDCVVVEQLNSQSREFVQRIGRGLRYRPNHTAKIFIIVSQGTQDERWLNDAVKSIPAEKIKLLSYKKYADR